MKLWDSVKGLLTTTITKIFIPLKCFLFQTAFCFFRHKKPQPYIFHCCLPSAPYLPSPHTS